MVYHIIDIETTGFNKVRDDILEVGYIRANHECEILGYGTLYFYRPEFNIESDAQRIHKLTREFLEPYSDSFEKNLAALWTLMMDGVLVTKSSSGFDINFIQEFMWKYGNGVNNYTLKSDVNMQKLMKDYYQEWYHKTYGRRTNAEGKLMEYIPVIGYTEERVKEEFKELFPDSRRDYAHSALYDAFVTYLSLKFRYEKINGVK